MGTDFRASPAIVRMDAISLEEMDTVKLMNRIDTKYFTTEEILDKIFEKAADQGYRVCEINGERATPYDSMYYDTSDLRMFKIHRAGKAERQKIRVRTYLISGVSYLEIKKKNNKGRTKKKRMPVPSEYSEKIEAEGAAEFIEKQSWFKAEDLFPACRTDFSRITLVNKEKTERITFDTALEFWNPRTDGKAAIENGVIIEVKQDGRLPSAMSRILRDLRVHQLKASKYCIGIVLTDSTVRPERFKERIREIDKISNNKTNH